MSTPTKQKAKQGESKDRAKPHGKQAILDLRPEDQARIRDRVDVGHYPSEVQALPDIIAIGLDQLDKIDPVTDEDRARVARRKAHLGRLANGHT